MFWFRPVHYCLESDTPIYTKGILKIFPCPFFCELFSRELWSSLNDLIKKREIPMKFKTYIFHSSFFPDKFTVFWISPLCLTLVEKLKIFPEHNSLIPLVTFELYTASFAVLTNINSKDCIILDGWSKLTFSYLGRLGFFDDMEFGVCLPHLWKAFCFRSVTVCKPNPKNL